MNDNGRVIAPGTGAGSRDTYILLWSVAALVVLDLLTSVLPEAAAIDAVRIDILPVLILGTFAALLSRLGAPAIIPAGVLAFASMIQAPFMLLEQEHCGAAVSNIVLSFLVAPVLFASPLHVIPTLGTSFALAQWGLRRMHIIAGAVISMAFVGLSAVAWWFVVLKMPGTGSCPNF